MPRQDRTLPHHSPMLPMLLVLSGLGAGHALSLAQEQLSNLPSSSDLPSSLDVPRFQGLRKGYESLQSRLEETQDWEDRTSDLIPATQIRILIPKLQLGPGSHVRMRIPKAALFEGLPEASRLHRALFRLSPTAPISWDVTRPLRRQLGLGKVLTLRLRSSLPAQGSTEQPQLELHWLTATARGRRSAHARSSDGCPLGAGRCCRLRSLRASLEDLGWADWVMAPREVDVRICVGACPSQFRSANTHAQMQARLHGLNPEAAPAPCCVPASYEPVVLMHRDSDGRVALTPFDDLVAKDCHCA
ncbi:PREDICTED: growth/differentiation factor 15 [Condylura cristata]|uniref:growth/differentiation factor 15 n=1 Tax=Condylura cristata TaxID=143302 RepID=UPI00033452C9|nr:PREDICTED: growth/differentiation factor 15 [Condylura cristata]XP_012584423.1 PREDICTED: growth/differentiation factor 15 [Condylura cristata]